MGLHLLLPYTRTAGAGSGSRANASTQAPGAFHSVFPHPPPESWSKPCHRHKMVTFGVLGEGARQSLKEPAPHPLPSRTRWGQRGMCLLPSRGCGASLLNQSSVEQVVRPLHPPPQGAA